MLKQVFLTPCSVTVKLSKRSELQRKTTKTTKTPEQQNFRFLNNQNGSSSSCSCVLVAKMAVGKLEHFLLCSAYAPRRFTLTRRSWISLPTYTYLRTYFVAKNAESMQCISAAVSRAARRLVVAFGLVAAVSTSSRVTRIPAVIPISTVLTPTWIDSRLKKNRSSRIDL